MAKETFDVTSHGDVSAAACASSIANLRKLKQELESSNRHLESGCVDLFQKVSELVQAKRDMSESLREIVDRIRSSRQSLTTEKKLVVQSVADLAGLLSSDEMGLALERLGALVSLAEKMEALSETGWLDRALLAILEGTSA